MQWFLGSLCLGDYLSDGRCLHGHRIWFFNIGRGHFGACDSCRTEMFLGGNLVSSWREETEDVWRKNGESVAGYEFVE